MRFFSASQVGHLSRFPISLTVAFQVIPVNESSCVSRNFQNASHLDEKAWATRAPLPYAHVLHFQQPTGNWGGKARTTPSYVAARKHDSRASFTQETRTAHRRCRTDERCRRRKHNCRGDAPGGSAPLPRGSSLEMSDHHELRKGRRKHGDQTFYYSKSDQPELRAFIQDA